MSFVYDKEGSVFEVVEIVTSAVCQIFFLLSAGTSPVKSWRSVKSSGRFFLKYSKCCSTSGFVGARKRTLLRGKDLRRLMESRRAMSVFPRPVGRTTRVLLSFVVSNIFCWYSRGWIFRRDIND